MRMTLPRLPEGRAGAHRVPAQGVELSPSPSAIGIQRKLTVNQPGDKYEQEADRVAEQVMRMPEPTVQRQCTCAGSSVGDCEECRKRKKTLSTGFLQREATSNSGGFTAPTIVSDVLNSPGSPIPASTRTSMEARFGQDFSHVRIHTDNKAANSAAAVQARAYTVGNNIVFGRGETPARDQRLLAHELTHVVQQSGGTAPRSLARSTTRSTSHHISRDSSRQLHRWPGDGMKAPGDCSWAQYLSLRGSVETAKAVTKMLGPCNSNSACPFLALKIAALSAELTARFALAATCFKGGDADHRDQMTEKASAIRNCYRYFSKSNCSPELVAVMGVVVARVRDLIAAATVAAMIAIVAALVLVILELVALIAAVAAEVAALAAVITEALAVVLSAVSA